MTMENPSQLSLEKALDQLRAGELATALQTLEALIAAGDTRHEVEELAATVRLQVALSRREPPANPPAPRRWRWPRPSLPRIAGAILFLVVCVMLAGMIGRIAPSALWQTELTHTLAPIGQAAVVGVVTDRAGTASNLPPLAPDTGRIMVINAGDEPLVLPTVSQIHLILDASGSMLAQLNGEQKIAIARTALQQLIDRLPSGMLVGLHTYGRNRPHDCSDIELIAAPGPLDPAVLQASVATIRPVPWGRTPIAASLSEALRLLDPQQPASIVLLSDGEESCNGDPVAVAAQMSVSHPNTRLHVIGFAVNDEQERSLQAIASAAKGTYHTADDVEQLVAAMSQAITPIYRLRDQNGRELIKARFNTIVDVTPGRYVVVVGDGQEFPLQTLTIAPGETLRIAVTVHNGQLLATVEEANNAANYSARAESR
ncbi:MAG: VWA domain-containing protein [Chloroflexus sp.]|nr:VWA domain-containing protein [Chloroflexus sp.]